MGMPDASGWLFGRCLLGLDGQSPDPGQARSASGVRGRIAERILVVLVGGASMENEAKGLLVEGGKLRRHEKKAGGYCVGYR
jgi:hypothetical protein